MVKGDSPETPGQQTTLKRTNTVVREREALQRLLDNRQLRNVSTLWSKERLPRDSGTTDNSETYQRCGQRRDSPETPGQQTTLKRINTVVRDSPETPGQQTTLKRINTVVRETLQRLLDNRQLRNVSTLWSERLSRDSGTTDNSETYPPVVVPTYRHTNMSLYPPVVPTCRCTHLLSYPPDVIHTCRHTNYPPAVPTCRCNQLSSYPPVSVLTCHHTHRCCTHLSSYPPVVVPTCHHTNMSLYPPVVPTCQCTHLLVSVRGRRPWRV